MRRSLVAPGVRPGNPSGPATDDARPRRRSGRSAHARRPPHVSGSSTRRQRRRLRSTTDGAPRRTRSSAGLSDRLLALSLAALLATACTSGAAWARHAAPAPESAAVGLFDAESSDRRVLRSADLRLDVDDVDGAGREIVRRTAAAGGFVLSSSRTHYQVKVPARDLDASLASFEALGEVTHRALHGEDVTAEYVDLEVRLANAHAARDSYAQLLQKAQSVEEVLKVEQALREVQERIELLQGRRKFLDEHLALSDVTIGLRERRRPGPLQMLWIAVKWPFEKLWWW